MGKRAGDAGAGRASLDLGLFQGTRGLRNCGRGVFTSSEFWGTLSSGGVTPRRILNLEVIGSQGLEYRTAEPCPGRLQVGLRGSTHGEQEAGAKQGQRLCLLCWLTVESWQPSSVPGMGDGSQRTCIDMNKC